MKLPLLFPILIILQFISVGPVEASSGQYREYYIYGKVLDTANNPLEGVNIFMRDVESSQSYELKTNKKGEFKFVGLPHGVYRVTISKPGYKEKNDEWRFETPQQQMVKVELPSVILATEEEIREFALNKELQEKFQNALEKIRSGDLDGALIALKEMVELKPDDINARYLIGVCYNRKDLPAEALAELSRVVELNPGFAGAHYQMGEAYLKLNQLEPALAAFGKSLELEPEKFEALFNHGLILYQLNRNEEALADFQKALALRDDDAALLEMIGRCHVAMGNYARSQEFLEKARALTKDPEKIKFLDQLIENLKKIKK